MTQKLHGYCLVDFLVLWLIYFGNITKIDRLTTDFSRGTQLRDVIIMSSSYSCKLRTEKLGVTVNRLLLGLRKVTATRQLKADHSFTVKATKPKIQRKIQR
jgi:hypothetical protein